jgi:hypothetical protein
VKNERKIKELLEIAPPPNRFGNTFFTEKTLSKLNSFELHYLTSLIEDFYVPRVKPTEKFRSGFNCPICNTHFEIRAEER